MDIAVLEPSVRERRVRLAVFAVWLAAIAWLAARHVVWRDEVRAFSMALQGDTVVDMLRSLHGEGHPAIWYLLLRGAHTLVPVREVLPAMGLLVAVAAMALLVWRSPFKTYLVAIVLFGAFGLFEFTVVARNYGISMLVLFALAHLYPKYRDRGIVIGFGLALLCNTNVPSTFLAAAFLLFWLIELVGEEGLSWSRRYTLFALNAGVAAIGAAICFITVFPTVHDAAPILFKGGISIQAVGMAMAFPAYSFWALSGLPPTYAFGALFSLIVFGAMLGLLRAPGAFLSALAALFGFELLFQLVYPGFYRHQSLFLIYLLTMYWLVARGRGGHWPWGKPGGAWSKRLEGAGRILFVLLLALQVLNSADLLGGLARGLPYSRSSDLAKLIERERLTDAVVIGDPDMFLEPLPYYTANPIYLMREQRFGNYARFTRKVRLRLTPDDYLADARALRARTGRPVVIVLEHRFDKRKLPFRRFQVQVWEFTANRAQVQRFLAGTRKLASFGPTITDESYDVYQLR